MTVVLWWFSLFTHQLDKPHSQPDSLSPQILNYPRLKMNGAPPPKLEQTGHLNILTITIHTFALSMLDRNYRIICDNKSCFKRWFKIVGQ